VTGIDDEETWTEVSLPPDARAGQKKRGWTLVHVFDGGEKAPVRAVWPAKEGAKIGRQSKWGDDLKLGDPRVSRHHVTVKSAKTSFILEVVGRGGIRHNGLIATGDVALVDGDVLRIGDSLFVARRTRLDKEEDVPEGTLTGIAPDIVELRHAVARVGPTDTTVLVLGETGVGKELVASALHAASGRGGSFVAVNCGAIPEQLAESQLFGHAAGAFTGATRAHPGHFRDADGGTLFLDEIGELPLELQPTLLRALDQGEVLGVGERSPTKVDVRVVAATNRDLYEEVQHGRFRKDLYARLSEITLRVPPLKTRREDVVSLFFAELDPPVTLGASAVEQLLTYRWPFNVREVKKLSKHVAVRAAGDPEVAKKIVFEHLERHAEETHPEPAAPAPAAAEQKKAAPKKDLPVPTGDELRALLEQHRGNVSAVARSVGRSRTQVYRWLEEHGLKSEDFR
jgi:DNA-binding NtrC family response regulator